jgi:hypothetical protein
VFEWLWEARKGFPRLFGRVKGFFSWVLVNQVIPNRRHEGGLLVGISQTQSSFKVGSRFFLNTFVAV